MTNQVDQLPYYDPLVKQGEPTKMSETWIASMSAFVETLNGYLSPFGMFMPNLTTAQRNTIQSPVPGQLIYNTTTGTAEYYNGTVWVPF